MRVMAEPTKMGA